jgi:membrane-bound metal-dependent hydrolase YbcI (DUF457 family)
MASQSKHLQTGAIIGAIVLALSYLQKQSETEGQIIDWQKLIKQTVLGIIVGAFAGILPDIFEPANYPGHRQILHSETIFCLCILLIAKIKTDSRLNENMKNTLICSLSGYISHLFVDSQTPSGLPII